MVLKKPAKLNLNELELPERQRRRGSFIVRVALQRMKLRQNKAALRAAAWMVLALPVIQVVLLVGVLNAAPWLALLGLEGFLISWLGASQLKRPNPESKLLGFGVALMNAFLLGVAGLFLGSHVFWVTGILGIAPVGFLVFRMTRARTVKLAWVAYVAPLLLLLLLAVTARVALELSQSEQDAGTRLTQLNVASYALVLRGGNGTEKSLLGLRRTEAAFETGDYEQAFQIAHQTLYRDGKIAGVPDSIIGTELLDSLLQIKAQSYYNQRWGKQQGVNLPIKPEPLSDDILGDETVNARWCW